MLSCSVTGCAWVKLTRTVHAPVLRDAYSTRHTSQCRREDCCCPVCRPFEECVPCQRDSLSGEEPAQRILDVRWSACCGVEEGKLRAELLFRVLYCCPMGRIHCTERASASCPTRPPAPKKLCCRVQVEQLGPARRGREDRPALHRPAPGLGRGQTVLRPGVRLYSGPGGSPGAPPAGGTLVLRTVEPQETPDHRQGLWQPPREILEANHLTPAALSPPASW